MKLLILLFIANFSLAESVYINPLDVRGGNSDQFAAVSLLIEDAVVNAGHSVVKNSSQSTMVLVPKLLSLGSGYIFSVQRLDKAGSIVDSEKLKSENLSDLDSVIPRVTRAALSSEKAEKNSRIGEVTDVDSSRNYERIDVRKNFYIGFGPGWADKLNGNDGLSFSLGFAWGLSTDFDLLLEYDYFNAKESKASMNLASFGAKYYLSRQNHTPYVLGHFGYGWGRFGDEDVSIFNREAWLGGWAVGAGVGMNFFRTSRVNFSVQAKAYHVFDSTESSTSNEDSGEPTITTLEFLINF